MCLYPTYVKNPKYKPNKKNKGKPPVCKDRRLLYIPTKCGCCIECRKEKQREWRVRLETVLTKEEILERYLNHVYFGHGYYGVKTAAKGYFKKIYMN